MAGSSNASSAAGSSTAVWLAGTRLAKSSSISGVTSGSNGSTNTGSSTAGASVSGSSSTASSITTGSSNATSSAAGSAGLVPGPGANVLGSGGYFLRADGSWAVPTNTWKAANTAQT